MKFSNLLVLLLTVGSSAWAGQIQVTGERSIYQAHNKVKAVRCDVATLKCEAPIYFGLNEVANVPDGKYLLGFENSVHPDFVDVNSYQMTQIQLHKISVAPKAGKSIKVFRDFSSEIERQKLFLTTLYFKKPFFKQAQYSFGDFYLAAGNRRDLTQRLTYEACEVSDKQLESYEPDAKRVCEMWKMKDLVSVREIFSFNDDLGTYGELWVARPGDVFKFEHRRHLVGIPVREPGWVLVFPGAYRILESGAKQSQLLTVGL